MGLSALKKIGVVLKLANAIAAIEQLNKERAPVSKYLPIIVTVVGTLAGALAVPDFIQAHATVFAVLTAAAQVLHAVLPSVFKA